MAEDTGLLEFIIQHADKLWSQTLIHLALTSVALFAAICIAIPVGIVISRKPKYASVVLAIAGILQTIPSIALLGMLIPILGIGAKPAIFALFLYALLPLMRNTYTGISGVDPVVKDAAKGIGMSDWQILVQVELPLAFPVIMAGVRTATVINVGVATLAAYIAAGGLGEFIFGGIALNNMNMILAGAIPAGLLALGLDQFLGLLQGLNWRKIKVWKVILPLLAIGVCSLAGLSAHFDVKLLAGFTPEFMGREDGYLGLKSKYKLNMETVVISDAVMYKALREKRLDVVSGYSTDGRLKAYDLIMLKDDQVLFPAYQAAPLVREDMIKRFPDLEIVLNQLAGRIDEEEMTAMNYQVDELKRSPEVVARDFMIKQNLYLKPKVLNGTAPKVRIGTKIFAEQYILAEIYRILIRGHTFYDVETKTGLGGTKICFEALQNNEIDFYPEYTGTGLLVLLQPEQRVRLALGRDVKGIQDYLDQEFHDRFRLKWLKPLGFNNTYGLMMRREQADALGVKTITELVNLILK